MIPGLDLAAPDSADALEQQRAYSAGVRAGRLGLSPSLNPHPAGTTLHQEWERARMNTVGADLARRIDAARRVA